MVKGWRNNPDWVRLYEEKKEKREANIIRKIQLEYEIKLMELKEDYYELSLPNQETIQL